MFVSPEKRTVAPDLLLTKAVSFPVSVVKADSVQGATNHVRREISFLWQSTGLSGKSIM